MPRNPIQEERIKKYFLDAAKDIIISEGIAALSVRNVAQKAGYSYATLYNYFKGVTGLITACIKDFQQDCSAYILEKTKGKHTGKEKLKSMLQAYIDYLVEYPSLFDLFYISGLSNEEANQSVIHYLKQLSEDVLQQCIEKDIYNKTQVEDIKENINVVIPGLLLSYLKRHYPGNYKTFLNLADKQLNNIFKSD